ncbi:MAG TPA: type II secretion system F family protein [Phycisphaerae bacterium]|jgi:type II secretory pathway component PulF|nr:type II secretion system F family protein [Phycisphaerae bacterium]
MKIQYAAYNKSGDATTAVIEAGSEEEAVDLLRQQGLFPTELTPLKEGAAAARGRNSRGGKGGPGGGARLKHLANFSRHLQILVSSGTPITEALAIVERQMLHPGWQQVLGHVRAKVESGASLTQALADRPDYFDAVTRSLIAAGETCGELPKMLDRLATLTRRQLKLRNTVVGAMVYPVLLCLVGISVMITLFIFVLPRFGDLFKTLDVPLPPTTTLLLTIGHFVQQYWWAVVAVVIVGLGTLKWWLGTDGGKRAVYAAFFRVPKINDLLKNLATARIARLLGTLVDSYVPLLDSLVLVKQAAGAPAYRDLIAAAEDAVTKGLPMSTAFSRNALVNPSVAEAVRNGEHTGKLGTLLSHVADFLDEENEIVLKSLSSLIEPIILIIMGAFVGFVAVSMFLPLFDLVGMAQGAGGRPH